MGCYTRSLTPPQTLSRMLSLLLKAAPRGRRIFSQNNARGVQYAENRHFARVYPEHGTGECRYRDRRDWTQRYDRLGQWEVSELSRTSLQGQRNWPRCWNGHQFGRPKGNRARCGRRPGYGCLSERPIRRTAGDPAGSPPSPHRGGTSCPGCSPGRSGCVPTALLLPKQMEPLQLALKASELPI